MVDSNHLESAGNVVVKDENGLWKLNKWAEAARKHGNHIWAQISHAGRQTSRFVNNRPKAPSVVQLKKMGLFGKPVAMSMSEIMKVIGDFVNTARICQKAGFTGVQIHAAHGYLISQFLSPLTNKRSDEWGGSLENRSKVLKLIIEGVRKEVGADFPISVKLNSADFQRGGFSEEESLTVVKMLDSLGVDLLEISGGTYEKLVFFTANGEEGKKMRASTMKREAYFIEFAEKVRQISQVPLMVTGGFRTHEFANQALLKGELDLIGMARPFVVNLPAIPGFIKGEVSELSDLSIKAPMNNLKDSAEAGFYARNINKLAKGKEIDLSLSPTISSILLVTNELRKAISRKLKTR